MSETTTLRDRLADNLAVLITTLVTFVVTAAISPVVDRVGRGWLVVAAALTATALLGCLVTLRRERRSLPLQAAIVALSLAALATLALGWLMRADPVYFDRPASLLLVDSSMSMKDKLDGATTKLDAATSALHNEARDSSSQLGLATYGVDDCHAQEPFDLREPISQAAGSRIINANLVPHGYSNLVSAASQALGQLQQFHKGMRHLVIMTASADQCGGNLRRLIGRAREQGVLLRWDIIGLGLDRDLDVDADEDVRVHYVDNQAELNDIVHELLVVETVTREFQDLSDYLNDTVVAAMGRTVDQVKAGKVISAAPLERVFEIGRQRFVDRSVTSTTKRSCRAVLNYERAQFARLDGALPELTALVDFDRVHSQPLDHAEMRTRDHLVLDWNVAIRIYNERTHDLDGLVSACLNALG